MGTLREWFNNQKIGARPDKRMFIDIYDFWFAPIKHKVTSLLEIGVQYGHSLEMWRDFFPEATIYGIDIDLTKCNIQDRSRIVLYEGSQSNVDLLQKVIHDAGEFDIVIDDGSHVGDDAMISYNTLIDHTRLLYIMEDIYLFSTHCIMKVMHLATEFWKHITNKRQTVEEAHQLSIRGIHIYQELLIIEKVYPFDGNPPFGGFQGPFEGE
jgi:hypothetical protein